MISVEYHDDLKEVQSDALLGPLLGDGEQDSPFDRLAWWQGLQDHCGMAPLLAVARNGKGAAVLPLTRKGRTLESLANWYSFRVRPVISSASDPDALLTSLAADLAGEAPRIILSGLPDEDLSATRLEQAFRAAGWLVIREVCDRNHVLSVGGRSYDEYIASRPGQLRTTLKRKSGKVQTEILTRFDANAWAEYEAIYGESWKPSEGSPAFLRAFAMAEADAGRLRLGIARAEGQAIAAQFWTVEGGTAFIHKLAHLESAKPLSPGTVLSAVLFRHVIDVDGVLLVDFGTGDDPYKRDWMEDVRLRYRLIMKRRGYPGNWPRIARRFVRRLAAGGRHG